MKYFVNAINSSVPESNVYFIRKNRNAASLLKNDFFLEYPNLQVLCNRKLFSRI